VDILRAAQLELLGYPTVELRSGIVTAVTGARGTFTARTSDGGSVQARRVLLATGVIDVVPGLAGLPELFGSSVHHCPHCDGYEYAGKPIGVYGQAGPGVEAAVAMLAWSEDIVLFTDGRPLDVDDRLRCERVGVIIREERIVKLEGQDGRLERVVLADGSPVARAGLFLVAGQREQSELAKQLGCELNADGVVVADEHALSSVPGVYVAGDASAGEQLVVVAAAQGAIAATKIHAALWEEDLLARTARR
jgi:thioredoxin reductase